MMSWTGLDKDTMQKFLSESILQLCRINIGMPGSYEVDGIICITRGSSAEVDRNTDEDQIVVKVHEHITTDVHDNVIPSNSDASVLRSYLASNSVPSRLMRNPPCTNPPLSLKRKANDENDNAIVDIVCNNGDKSSVTSAKLLRYDNREAFESDGQAQLKGRLLCNARAVDIFAGSFSDSETDNSRWESYSCGSCLLDFDSWISLQGHFQQSHASGLEHYCCTCAVGFLSAADLGKHNSSVHKQASSTAVAVSRRKQNKPRKGVANDEVSVPGDYSEDEMRLLEDRLKPCEPQHKSGDVRENATSASSQLPLLQQQQVTKMLHHNNTAVVKQEQTVDQVLNTAALEIVSERICPHCTSFFADFSTFSVHCQAVHHRFPCPHCLQTFTQRVNRDRHLYNHTGEKPYECAVCHEGFTRRDALRKHQLKCNHNTGSPENAYSEQDVDVTIPFSDDSDPDEITNTNDECGLDLSMPSNYSRTLKEEFKEVTKALEEDSSAVNKQNMPKSFMLSHPSSAIVRHSPLPIVSSEWTEVDTLGRFRSLDQVDVPAVLHQPLTEGRWYCCDICRTSVVGAAAFELHCRNEHRRTPCVYCGKTFSQKGNMERHQRQHTGERPFACPHCSCSYTRKETLKVHINQAHPATVASDAAAAAQKETSSEASPAAVSDAPSCH